MGTAEDRDAPSPMRALDRAICAADARWLAEFLGGVWEKGAFYRAECEGGDLVYVHVCVSSGRFVEGGFTEFVRRRVIGAEAPIRSANRRTLRCSYFSGQRHPLRLEGTRRSEE
jgi:hypothetical protein